MLYHSGSLSIHLLLPESTELLSPVGCTPGVLLPLTQNTVLSTGHKETRVSFNFTGTLEQPLSLSPVPSRSGHSDFAQASSMITTCPLHSPPRGFLGSLHRIRASSHQGTSNLLKQRGQDNFHSYCLACLSCTI